MYSGIEGHHFPSSTEQHIALRALGEERRRPGNVTSDTNDTCVEGGGQLTMGIIGCLPDNVQQAIKSFSIRRGKQHVTFAFPFMEDLIRGFDKHRSPLHPPEDATSNETFGLKEEKSCPERFQSITPALFFDRCPEVIYGFETLVTLVPSTNRSGHLIGLLTVNQKETSEGFRRHIESLFRIMVSGKDVSELKNLPLIALDLKGLLLQEALDAGADAVLEVHGDTFARTYPEKSSQQLLHLIKEKIIKPLMVPYHELLYLNIQEVEKKLQSKADASTGKGDDDFRRFDSAHFHSLVQLLQSPSCSPSDFRQIHTYFMSLAVDAVVQEFWRVWSHDQVAAKVFPVSLNKSRTGSFHYFAAQTDLCINQAVNAQSLLSKTLSSHGAVVQHPSASVLGTVMTRVPVKEGLISVIKCLKNQDLGISSLKGDPINLAYYSREVQITEHSKSSKDCKCGKGLTETPAKERAVAAFDETTFGVSRTTSSAAGFQSAFHPPRTSNFSHQISRIPQNVMIVKPASSYPSSSSYYASKSHPEGMGSDIKRQELLFPSNHGTIGVLPPGVPPFPFLLGYYGPIKSGSPGPPTHLMPSPVISLHNTPLLYCQWKSLEHDVGGNW